MLFAHIIAQKRKKDSKKYLNVKNCMKMKGEINFVILVWERLQYIHK
ncbi:hypothetical protein EMIT079MI2_10268 [Bacillus sp. IT-79MI2]|nr:hypothetical protein BTH41_00388 [Bacillus mycoides]